MKRAQHTQTALTDSFAAEQTKTPTGPSHRLAFLISKMDTAKTTFNAT